MVVNHELEVCVHGSVDKTETVGGARLDRYLEARARLITRAVISVYIGAVNETVVECWRTVGLSRLVELIRSLVRPVVEKDNTYRDVKSLHLDECCEVGERLTHIFIIICRSRAVDDYATKNALPGLQTKV